MIIQTCRTHCWCRGRAAESSWRCSDRFFDDAGETGFFPARFFPGPQIGSAPLDLPKNFLYLMLSVWVYWCLFWWRGESLDLVSNQHAMGRVASEESEGACHGRVRSRLDETAIDQLKQLATQRCTGHDRA